MKTCHEFIYILIFLHNNKEERAKKKSWKNPFHSFISDMTHIFIHLSLSFTRDDDREMKVKFVLAMLSIMRMHYVILHRKGSI